MRYTVERTTRLMNTIPAQQDVVIIRDASKREVALMGRWTLLCFPGGSVNAMDATDEQILAAWMNDESVFD